MVLHFPKISIKNVFKRSCALLAALGIALYSLITAPLFGVHAVGVDSILGWLEDTARSFGFGAIQDFEDGELDVSDLIEAITGGTVLNIGLPLAKMTAEKMTGTFDYTSNHNVTPSNTIGCSGIVYIDDKMYSVGCYTADPTIITYDGTLMGLNNNIGCWLFTIGGYDYYMQFKPLNGDYTWANGDTITLSTTYDISGVNYRFIHSLQFKNSSGASVFREFELTYIIFDNNGRYYKSWVRNWVNSSFGFYCIFRTNAVVSYDSFDLDFSNAINQYNPGMYISGIEQTTSTSVTRLVGKNQSIQFVQPPNITNLTDENIYNYYVDYNYPAVIRDYPIYTTLEPPQDYVVPTDPTEPNTGTTGGVIIIDPFTLPPEWLEDNAELGTSHYELDSDQWEDPLEIIKKYKHADPSGEIPTGVVNDDGSFEGPADVVEAMEAFTDYAYMILTESGLLWVVASLVSVGLIVRLFTLK